MSQGDSSGEWSAVGLPHPTADPPASTGSSKGSTRALVIVLVAMSVCCWGGFGGLFGLSNVFNDGEVPPPAGSLPAIPGVSFHEGNSGSYCGSGGCFSTPLIGEASDGASRAVVVDRIVRELNHDGWTVAETDQDHKGSVVAMSDKGVNASFQWKSESQQDIYSPLDQYDLQRQVKVVLDWSGEGHPTPSSVISLAPGTTMGNLLILAIALTLCSVIAIIAAVLRRRSRA